MKNIFAVVCLALLSVVASAQATNQNTQQQVTITVQTVTPLVLTPPTKIPTAIVQNGVGQPYGPAAFTVAGGTAPYTWKVSVGTLPAGLTLATGGTAGNTGTISGTPSGTAATSTFTLQATDSSGALATLQFNWIPSPSPSVNAYNLYNSSTPGGPYAKVVTVSTTGFSQQVPRQPARSAYYVATAVAGSNESGNSNEVKVSIQ